VLQRGQRVSVEITPVDLNKRKGRPYRTPPVAVGNTPPSVTAVLLKLSGEHPSLVEAQAVAVDQDYDRITLVYRWIKNGQVVEEGEQSTWGTKGLAGGDKIAVEVMGKDATGSGASMRSNELVVASRVPTFVSTPVANLSSRRFEYGAKAVDPDGDVLTYRLEKAPPGMVIDSVGGQVTWSAPADQQGTVRVRIVAVNSHGLMAAQEFDLAFLQDATKNPA
jgi:hypothetical protein